MGILRREELVLNGEGTFVPLRLEVRIHGNSSKLIGGGGAS